MRKLIVILMLAISFALGIFSQNLIAGVWGVTPTIGTPTFPLYPRGSKFLESNGKMFYRIPNGWRAKRAGSTEAGNYIFIDFRKI
jgi:hypothetical protein